MLSNQAHLFDLPQEICYLNGAYMSPQLKSVTMAGQAALFGKARPYNYQISDFFEPVRQLKANFAKLIDVEEPERIALIPSVSYGIANVTNNIHLMDTDEILLVDEQFPSNYYAWEQLSERYEADLGMVVAPDSANRSEAWTEAILDAIYEDTKVVAISHAHWADGTLFDLKAIREKTREMDALLIIDGTQSVGALPFGVKEFEVDALVCGGYKWLLGPYALGLAYYGEYFDYGTAIEENWINRHNSHDFRALVNYEPEYRPYAGRYNVGEQSNFLLVPMLNRAITQLLEWGVANIQSYTKSIAVQAVEQLRAIGCQIEQEDRRCGHLFGVRLPKHINLEKLRTNFENEQVFVSIRGNAIRISPNVYNDAADFERLVSCFINSAKH
ncbi:MAG: aminotransferase class V-fold PLP-dependent enzyme [Bacteroidota bacterium]